jgi:hypothetical protein
MSTGGDTSGFFGWLKRRFRRSAPRVDEGGAPSDESSKPGRIPKVFWWLPAFGLVPLFLFSFAQGIVTNTFLVVLSTAWMSAGASFLVGAVLGFLFGYPQPVAVQSGVAPKSEAYFALNSNLSQVSDWLTKILIGIGLVQLGVLASNVREAGSFIGDQMGGVAGGEAIGIATIVYFLLTGLLLGYLWTAFTLGTELEKTRRTLEPPRPLPPFADLPEPLPPTEDGVPSAADDTAAPAQVVRAPDPIE